MMGSRSVAAYGTRTTRRGLRWSVATFAAATLIAAGALPTSAQELTEEETALRAEMLAIPGVGVGSPTDADWQKVGELALGPTKENIAEGECAGVELTFMGLINQNLHNFLFRGFLKPWEAYTGAKINWIDLAQRDYNGFLQQGIATSTVNWDIMEMGAPFEGDMAGRGLLDPMPDWVADQIDMDDYVDYLKAPVGTWDGVTYRISVDGDTHTYAYRKDYYENADLAAAWAESEYNSGGTEWAVPATWEELNAQSKFLAGKTDPSFGGPAYGVLDPLNYIWGGFGFYFLEDRAVAYSKVPGEPAYLFDPETMEPLVNDPGWVQAIQDVIDLMNTDGAYPPDQINRDPNLAFDQFLPGTGSSVLWWGDVGSNARTSDSSVVGDLLGFDINPGATRYYDWRTDEWVEEPNQSPNNAYIGWGVYVTSRAATSPNANVSDETWRKCAWSAAAHLGGKDLSLWTAAYPSGFQPYRNSHFIIDEWVNAGYDQAFIEDYLSSNADSYNHPNGANEPRIPGIFQYYSRGEDELVKGLGSGATAQEIADNIHDSWEDLTDQIGREQQLALYRASLGLPAAEG
jgi:multiple sugar transport system substrate-binding protein